MGRITILFLITLIVYLLIKNCVKQDYIEKYRNSIHSINVKIVEIPEELNRGLMYRKVPLENNEGMLFKYPDIDYHTFWMKNTFIPLDVIFFDTKFNVIGFVENNRPHNLMTKGINKKSKYFLEVNSGYILRNNIRNGDFELRVSFKHLDNNKIIENISDYIKTFYKTDYSQGNTIYTKMEIEIEKMELLDLVTNESFNDFNKGDYHRSINL